MRTSLGHTNLNNNYVRKHAEFVRCVTAAI